MRVGILALLHESNTFSSQPTSLDRFRDDLWLESDAVRAEMALAHHEVGGFFHGLDELSSTIDLDVVPLFAGRALPAGTITEESFARLQEKVLTCLAAAGQLDGLLVAVHGAAVSESHNDADGHLLSVLRQRLGPTTPIVGTLDLHANLSASMVQNCNALIAYRTNPHLDQRQRGYEAAVLLVKTLLGEVRPTMSAILLPMAINIEKQCTDDEHLRTVYRFADQQRSEGAISNSILLGFPYADVVEMGASVVVITDNDVAVANQLTIDLATTLWRQRKELRGELTSVEQALNESEGLDGPIGLLDMGDNVGGGSAADGTELIAAIHQRAIGPSFACLFDPSAVVSCDRAGLGASVDLRIGGKTDGRHGAPLSFSGRVRSLHDGVFAERQARHGGMSHFNQGRTAIVDTDRGLSLMLTSRRMVPFSLEQLRSCDLDPTAFRILVAKGVNAPIAAYGEICKHFIRVNTQGATCADLAQLTYAHRRRPLYPLETDVRWQPEASTIHGYRQP